MDQDGRKNQEMVNFGKDVTKFSETPFLGPMQDLLVRLLQMLLYMNIWLNLLVGIFSRNKFMCRRAKKLQLLTWPLSKTVRRMPLYLDSREAVVMVSGLEAGRIDW